MSTGVVNRLPAAGRLADDGGHGHDPSTMSLLGLVRHLAEMERATFRVMMAGQDVPRLAVGQGACLADTGTSDRCSPPAGLAGASRGLNILLARDQPVR